MWFSGRSLILALIGYSSFLYLIKTSHELAVLSSSSVRSSIILIFVNAVFNILLMYELVYCSKLCCKVVLLCYPFLFYFCWFDDLKHCVFFDAVSTFLRFPMSANLLPKAATTDILYFMTVLNLSITCIELINVSWENCICLWHSKIHLIM